MDRFFSLIHENWTIIGHPTQLAAYALWRLNWIHPFVEGNGRTARAACYYLICLKHGKLLPGKKIVPERIREGRRPYYDALTQAETLAAIQNCSPEQASCYPFLRSELRWRR